MRVDIFAQINQERDRQDDKWGGASHDRGHFQRDWLGFLRTYLKKVADAITRDEKAERGSAAALAAARCYRYHLLQVAALAVAALEAFDANNPHLKPGRSEPVRPKELGQ